MSRKNHIPVDDPASIALTVEDIRLERHADWSRDMLLCHPAEAMDVCREVRRRLHRKLADHEILWTYLNQSKRSKLAIAADARKRRNS